jgi:hypothetical protein
MKDASVDDLADSISTWLAKTIVVIVFGTAVGLLWNMLAPTYLYFAPIVYQHIPWVDSVGIAWLALIARRFFLESIFVGGK